MRAVGIFASIDIASAVGELCAYGFQVLGRVEMGFLEMVQQTLEVVSFGLDLRRSVRLTLMVDTKA